jgi:hypothetical protein
MSQAFNRYSYVLNAPLALTDPSGFAPPVFGEVVHVTDGAGAVDQTTRSHDYVQLCGDSSVAHRDRPCGSSYTIYLADGAVTITGTVSGGVLTPTRGSICSICTAGPLPLFISNQFVVPTPDSICLNCTEGASLLTFSGSAISYFAVSSSAHTGRALHRDELFLDQTGSWIRSFVESEVAARMFENYWLGLGDITLTDEQFVAIVLATDNSAVFNMPVMVVNGTEYYVQQVSNYGGSQYAQAFGTATLFRSLDGVAVGFRDTYNMNWFATRSWMSHAQVFGVSTAAFATGNGVPFRTCYGIGC